MAQKWKVKENRIKRAIADYLTLKGILVWYNKSTGVWDPTRKMFLKGNSPYEIRGTSDLFGVLPQGQFLAIEVKTESGVVSEHQAAFIESVKQRGGIAFVARSVDDVRRELEPWLGVTL